MSCTCNIITFSLTTNSLTTKRESLFTSLFCMLVLIIRMGVVFFTLLYDLFKCVYIEKLWPRCRVCRSPEDFKEGSTVASLDVSVCSNP